MRPADRVELLFTYRNKHWFQIREAQLTDSPTDLIYLLKGVAHQGPSSYYKPEGGIGMVEASDTCVEYRFTLSKATGTLTIEPVFLAPDGSHLEPVTKLTLPEGTIQKR